jgi:tRNA-binding protein
MATIQDFQNIDIRVGKIVAVEEFPEARKPAYRLQIDFGAAIGVKRSCAQFPARYTREELMHKLVLAAVNLPPRQIGPAVSEVLTLGLPDQSGHAILIQPEREVPLGGRLF